MYLQFKYSMCIEAICGWGHWKWSNQMGGLGRNEKMNSTGFETQ